MENIIYADGMFKELKKYEGQEIVCYYWHYGRAVTCEDKLETVSYFRGVECKGSFIPFIGSGCAIVGIKLKSNGSTIYYNPNIEEGYNLTDQKEIDKVRALTYGSEVVFKQKNRRDIREQNDKKRSENADKRAKLKRQLLIKRGLLHVHEDLRDEWVKHVTINTTDAYSCAIIEMACDIMDALSEGASREIIAEICAKKRASGYSIGCAIEMVLHFTNLLEVLALPESTNPQRTLK